MKLLISHIEYLLTENDCVIVPGFGGFVIQPIATHFAEHEVLPPSREICFNAGLTHDDGLLISSISQVSEVSYSEARRLLLNDLELFTTELSYKQRLPFGKIGLFSLDENKNRVFEPSNGNLIHLENYGLTTVKLALLSELKRQDDNSQIVAAEKDADMIQIRFSKRKVLRTIASVAAVWLLWVFSTPVTDVAHQTSCAGFVDSSYFMKSVPQKVKKVATPVADSVEKKDTVEKEVIVSKTAEPIAAKEEISNNADAAYYIVLGSFQSEKSAVRHQEQLVASGIADVKVVKLGTLMRTTLKGFSDKAEAEKYLHNIRSDRDEYSEAWVYCKK